MLSDHVNCFSSNLLVFFVLFCSLMGKRVFGVWAL